MQSYAKMRGAEAATPAADGRQAPESGHTAGLAGVASPSCRHSSPTPSQACAPSRANTSRLLAASCSRASCSLPLGGTQGSRRLSSVAGSLLGGGGGGDAASRESTSGGGGCGGGLVRPLAADTGASASEPCGRPSSHCEGRPAASSRVRSR
eukprot:scaffold24935_cov63-Phaeocystis_antarctica.AAC.2